MGKSDFTSALRSAIEVELIKNYNQLVDPTLQFINENIRNCHKCAIENISQKQQPFDLNYESCINFVLDSSSDIRNTKFGYKISDGRNWWGNEIKFPFASRMPDLPRWGSTDFFEYRRWRDDLEYSCEDEFWRISKHEENYSRFLDLNIFDDRLFNSSEASWHQANPKSYLRKDIWMEYLSSLTGLFFPEFVFCKKFSTSKIKRHLLEIKQDVWFGFEYDESELSYELKQGNPALPDFFNLILVNTNFNKGEKKSNYYFKNHPDIITLGIFGNPLLYHPCYSLLGYMAVDVHRKNEEGRPYLNQIIKLNEDKFRIVHSKTLNESIKRHAFFYMSLLSSTSHIYSNYLKNALMRALQ